MSGSTPNTSKPLPSARAAKALRAIQRNWQLVPTGHHPPGGPARREAAQSLGQAPDLWRPPARGAPGGVHAVGGKPDFGLAAPARTRARRSLPLRRGQNRAAEPGLSQVVGACSRAWASLPGPGELCLDMGGSPGGWAWVLAGLGARVFCIDKAPLAPNVAGHPLVESCQGSAFGLDPRHVGAVDWLFSDVICYPDRLYDWLGRWLELGQCRRFVLTVKLQGETDFALLARFPGHPRGLAAAPVPQQARADLHATVTGPRPASRDNQPRATAMVSRSRSSSLISKGLAK